MIVLANDEWHPGVVGLVAARVKEALNRPAVIIGSGGSASCRSVEGFDIGQAVIAAREAGILVKGGGHAAAAGLTVLPERIDELREFMSARAQGFVAPPVMIDIAVPCGELTMDIPTALERLQPFGTGNTKPMIAVYGGRVKRATIVGQNNHIKLLLTGPQGETEAIMYRGVGTPLGESLRGTDGLHVDLLGEVKIDEYGGRKRATLEIRDAIVEHVADDEMAA